MGINLCLKTLEGIDHPDWDWIRYAGDREFVDLMRSLPSVKSGRYDDEFIRPTDFTAWRTAVGAANLQNEGRHARLLDLLEADPHYWLFVNW